MLRVGLPGLACAELNAARLAARTGTLHCPAEVPIGALARYRLRRPARPIISPLNITFAVVNTDPEYVNK